MAEPTTRPTNEQHLARLSRMAEEIRGQLAAYHSTLGRSIGVSPGPAACGQISGTPTMIRSNLEDRAGTAQPWRCTEIGQVVNSSLDLTTVLNEVMDTIIRLTARAAS
jgi:hypothetical protein